MYVEKLVNEAMASNSRKMSIKFNNLILYYQKKWQELYYSCNKDITKIKELKIEVYKLKDCFKEDIIDRLWEKITTEYTA